MRFILIVVALLVAPMAWAGPPLDDDDNGGLGSLAGLGSSQDGPESTVIVVTDKGTAFANGATITKAAVAIVNGGSVLVAFQCISTTDGATATWNGQALTADATQTSGTGETIIFSKHDVTGATGDVVVTAGSGGNLLVAVVQVEGLTATATDKTATAAGSGDAPSSGNTAVTSQDDELLFGAIGTTNQDSPSAPGGAWSNSFTGITDFDDGGDTIGLTTGYRIVAGAGAYAAAKTGLTGADDVILWRALIATYKKAP